MPMALLMPIRIILRYFTTLEVMRRSRRM